MVEVALIAGSVSLLTVMVTTLALWRVRQTQSLVNLVHAHRTIAEDAVSAYERARAQLQESSDQEGFQETIFEQIDRIRTELGNVSNRIGHANTDSPPSQEPASGIE